MLRNVFILFILIGHGTFISGQQIDFDLIKKRIKADLIQNVSSDNQIRTILTTANSDGSF